MMQTIHTLWEYLRDPSKLLIEYAHIAYPVMMLIIFLETGALVALLPGDSLLVVAGTFADVHDPASGAPALNILYLNLLLIPCAIIGDAVSYTIGSRTGAMLFKNPQARLFKPEYLKAAQDFYEKHGGKAIIMARFVPIVRTFVPVVAGIAKMPYRNFAIFNVVGGAAWVLSMTMIGFALSRSLNSMGIDIAKHIDKIVIGVVTLSILPGIIGWLKNRFGKGDVKAAT